MAFTNFANLTTEQLTSWQRRFWRFMRNREWLNRYVGDGEMAMIQRISELTDRNGKGARAVLTLIKESIGDGVAGDRQLEGNEEALASDDIVIQIDQLRHAHRGEGRMAEQKSVVRFRNEAMSNLAYWLGDRRSQLAMLALNGIGYSFNLDGSARVGSAFTDLEFAADVTAPSANRYGVWDTTGLVFGAVAAPDNANLTTADTLKWQTLIDMKAQASWYQLKPVRTEVADGEEIDYYHVFVDPFAMADLKKDPEFKTNLQHAMARSPNNPLFRGARRVFVDGMVITETDYAYTTRGADPGSKWGAGGNVDGGRVVMAGAQALGMADIGSPIWVEKKFDFDNQPAISVGKIFGFIKPQFDDPRTGTTEDFGVINVDVAHNV